MVEQSCVVVRQSEQQGRFLEATRDLKAGECIILEPPVLLVVAHECLQEYCAVCLRRLPSRGHLVCQKTQQACFCTSECVAAAEHTVGGPDMALRKVLAAVPWAKLSIDECNQARFMLHVLSLRRDSSCSEEAGKKWAQFCSLHALPPDSSTHDRVWEVIRTLIDPDVSHDDVSLCLRKEAANAFGIMAPLGKDMQQKFLALLWHLPENLVLLVQLSYQRSCSVLQTCLRLFVALRLEECHGLLVWGGERSIRGTGVYELTSMTNHSCMPTAARVDDPDCEGPLSTHMRVKLIQDVPAGEEVSISYFPMHLELQQRQERCQELYGFTCVCMRCKNDMTREKSAAAESFASHVACDSSVKASSMSPDQREQAAVEAQYIELYLMKYICTVPDCFGTFVPKDNHPTRDNNGSSSRSMTCNVCGNERTEEEFMSVVQKLLSESSD